MNDQDLETLARKVRDLESDLEKAKKAIKALDRTTRSLQSQVNALQSSRR